MNDVVFKNLVTRALLIFEQAYTPDVITNHDYPAIIPPVRERASKHELLYMSPLQLENGCAIDVRRVKGL